MRHMRSTRLRAALVVVSLAAATVALAAPPASAQATRTWVSGVGDDANPCSRTAPCKTFAGAISKTATGGVINALDDGGFGAVTITKAITIDGGGHIASALVSGTNGIIVNAPANAQVVLRGIDVKGLNTAEGTCGGLNGVQILNAASVRLDDVTISGFAIAVNAPLSNSSADVFVDLSLNDLRINDNCQYGVRIAPDAGHAGRLALDGAAITGSNVALSVGAGAEGWVSNSKIYLNNLGVQPAGGKIHAYCNNQVAGNATDGAFTDDLCGGAATAPPPATTYCTVPNLKKKTVAQATSALTGAGCTAGKVKKKKAPKKYKGKVFAQAVAPGILVKTGTAVALTVGK
jgi:PASTA domain-containing protein